MTTPVGKTGPDAFNQIKNHTSKVASPMLLTPPIFRMDKSFLFTHKITKGENPQVTRLARDTFSIP